MPCEKCPFPEDKKIFDETEGDIGARSIPGDRNSRKADLAASFEEAAEINCSLGSEGCFGIFVAALNANAQRLGFSGNETLAEVRKRIRGMRDL